MKTPLLVEEALTEKHWESAALPALPVSHSARGDVTGGRGYVEARTRNSLYLNLSVFINNGQILLNMIIQCWAILKLSSTVVPQICHIFLF